ncbi:tubulin-tyrosine ligase/Tubulin polyglutamylase, partial [Kipferlia bialata]
VGLLKALEESGSVSTLPSVSYFPLCFDCSTADTLRAFIAMFRLSKALSTVRHAVDKGVPSQDRLGVRPALEVSLMGLRSRLAHVMHEDIDNKRHRHRRRHSSKKGRSGKGKAHETQDAHETEAEHGEGEGEGEGEGDALPDLGSLPAPPMPHSQEWGLLCPLTGTPQTLSVSSAPLAQMVDDTQGTGTAMARDSPYGKAVCAAPFDALVAEGARVAQALRHIDTRLQYSISGYKNSWVIKPAGKSRGRGIFVSDDLQHICDQVGRPEETFVAQRYVERPLLVHDYKFDIRQWVVVSSLNPLVIWAYDTPYLRFCSTKFSLEDLDDPSIHLANNSIQKHLPEYGQDAGITGEGNMWDWDGFREWVESMGHAEYLKHMGQTQTEGQAEAEAEGGVYASPESLIKGLRHRMMEIIIASISCGRFDLTCPAEGFEIYGYDFLVDRDMVPWLLEINSSPTLEHATPLVTRHIQRMTKGLVSILVDTQRGLGVKTKARTGPAFPSIDAPHLESILEEGAPRDMGGWDLIYKESSKMTCLETAFGLKMGVTGTEIPIPPIEGQRHRHQPQHHSTHQTGQTGRAQL